MAVTDTQVALGPERPHSHTCLHPLFCPSVSGLGGGHRCTCLPPTPDSRRDASLCPLPQSPVTGRDPPVNTAIVAGSLYPGRLSWAKCCVILPNNPSKQPVWGAAWAPRENGQVKLRQGVPGLCLSLRLSRARSLTPCALIHPPGAHQVSTGRSQRAPGHPNITSRTKYSEKICPIMKPTGKFPKAFKTC